MHGNDTYANFSRFIGVDMTRFPDRAYKSDIASKILVFGMKNGSFTGKKLSDYFNSTKSDFAGARNIIIRNDLIKN